MKNKSMNNQITAIKPENCYLCKSKSLRKLFTKHSYLIYQCNDCHLQFTDLKEPYSQFVKEFYGKSYFEGGKARNAYADYEGDKEIIVKNFDHKLRKIKQRVSNGNLLDVGCATGLFLESAKNCGYSIAGIEPSEYAFGLAKRRLGNSVKLGTVEDTEFRKASFDLITLFDVFEHLGDPLANLDTFSKWLKKGGYLVITTGDSGSLLAKIMKKYWHFYNPPQHLFFYSQRTIKIMLDKASFEIKNVEMEGKWFSLRYILHLARTIYANPMADYFYKGINELRLGKVPIYLNFSDTMTVYAVKKF